MARKRKEETAHTFDDQTAEITIQPISETIEKNYMPYAMSVIISRAIPEIDGFKPAHRKLLYTMYKMGLLTGARTKSANVVGATMKLNPHGDASIYETMVRLTRGNETLLHPFIDSKGSFGKQYSRDMAYAAARYTEVKLDAFCQTIFSGIDKDAVDFQDNYDGTMKEPLLLPTAFPNILVSPNKGIAVGMASNICSFNLSEICDGTIALLQNPDISLNEFMDIVVAPDFPGGASIIYDRMQLKEIYRTGRGSFALRARYVYNKKENCIEILQIPYTTSIEAIIKKVTDLVKEGKLKEVADIRDEIDLSGFKLTIDLRRGVDADKLMQKLYKMTPLQDHFACDFNVLIGNRPMELGVMDILREWIKFRTECVKRELRFDLNKKEEKLHLLLGLGKILLDIDKAIHIIRKTENDKDVVPNLMQGFDIDQVQANFVAEIKLRHLNREYILSKTQEINDLQTEIANLRALIDSEKKIRAHIASQLKDIKKKYAQPRRTQLIYQEDLIELPEQEQTQNYPVKVVFTKEGYFKKITMQSLRGNDEQKLKDGDEIVIYEDAQNTDEVLFFGSHCQLYKAHLSDFDCTKASALGDYIPAKLGFDPDEKAVFMKVLSSYHPNHAFIFLFENGKGVRVPVTAYETKSNRKKLVNAYSDASALVAIFYESQPMDLVLVTNLGRAITISSALIPLKTTKNANGVQLITLKGKNVLQSVYAADHCPYENPSQYHKIKIPATPMTLAEQDIKKKQNRLF